MRIRDKEEAARIVEDIEGLREDLDYLSMMVANEDPLLIETWEIADRAWNRILVAIGRIK